MLCIWTPTEKVSLCSGHDTGVLLYRFRYNHAVLLGGWLACNLSGQTTETQPSFLTSPACCPSCWPFPVFPVAKTQFYLSQSVKTHRRKGDPFQRNFPALPFIYKPDKVLWIESTDPAKRVLTLGLVSASVIHSYHVSHYSQFPANHLIPYAGGETQNTLSIYF